MQPFQYPDAPHVRLHGPSGYESYDSYRDWLRDEFHFRCVYCLNRENWNLQTGAWHIDHLLPKESYPDKVVEYDNLLYSCASCNLGKGNRELSDPCTCMLRESVSIFDDGRIEGRTTEAQRVIEVLGLNGSDYVEYRSNWIGIYSMLMRDDYSRFLRLMGYPLDLPDLRRKQCPENSRPEGLDKCCFVRRENGELPDYY